MPTYYARANGNVNGAIWATTPTGTAGSVVLDPSDVLMANNFTVTLNISVTVAEIRNDGANGATAGGGFTLNGGVTLTANCISGAATLVTWSGLGASSSIVGNITGLASGGAVLATSGSVGTLTITGSITSQSGNAVYVSGGLAVNIVGNVTSVSGRGVWFVNTTTPCTITGNVTGGSGSAVEWFSSPNNVTITGTVTGGGSASAVASAQVGATITINGAVFGGNGASGVAIAGGGTLVVNGTVTGASSVGVAISGTSIATITRAKGGPLPTSAVGVSNGTAGSIVSVSSIEYGDLGASPTSGPIRLTDESSNVALVYRFGTSKKTLVDTAATNLLPAASNVRSGTVYNAGQTVGTMAVPPAASVAIGVPVDNTTGTAALTPKAVWDYATASATTAGSMGERLANAATVASTGQQIADAVTA